VSSLDLEDGKRELVNEQSFAELSEWFGKVIERRHCRASNRPTRTPAEPVPKEEKFDGGLNRVRYALQPGLKISFWCEIL